MNITLIGAGSMGSVLAKSLAKEHKVQIYDKTFAKAEKLAREIGGGALQSPLEKLTPNHIIILAVRPQNLNEAARELKNLSQGKLLISILSGICVKRLKSLFPTLPILRIMPNLAIEYGKGVIAAANTQEITPLKPLIETLFAPLGSIYFVKEDKIDCFTALTGSGPAFVYALFEGMIEAALEMGFTSKESYPLVKKMIEGAFVVLDRSDKLAHELKEEYAVTGGTTVAGLAVLEENNVCSHLTETFLAAYNRAKELGQ